MRFATIASMLAVSVALVGCGSSRLSHERFVQEANAICSDYRAKVQKLRRPRTVTEIETYARKTLELYRAALEQLESLQPPKADEPQVRQWLAVDRRVAADQAGVVEAAGRRNLPDVEAASRRKDLHDLQSTSLSAQLGVTTCTRS